MNTDLMLRVKRRILAEPKSLDMGLWQSKKARSFCGFEICGTVACVAGHVILESGRVVPDIEEVDGLIGDAAAHLLRISSGEGHELFHFHNPEHEPFHDDPYHNLRLELLLENPGSQAYADIVGRAIDLCILRCEGAVAPRKSEVAVDILLAK